MSRRVRASDDPPKVPAPLRLGTAQGDPLLTAEADGDHATLHTFGPDAEGVHRAPGALGLSKRSAALLAEWLAVWARPNSKLVLWGIDGIAKECKVHRRTVYGWIDKPSFPRPVKVVGGSAGRVWEARAVKAWVRLARPAVGRPKKREARH